MTEAPPPPASNEATFTGRARRRTTRRSVKVIDAVTKYGITIGGLGVVAALAAIILFLVGVVLPLFYNADTDRLLVDDLPASAMEPQRRPVAVALDENLKGLWTLDATGSLILYQTNPGSELTQKVSEVDLSDVPVTAVSESRGVVGLGREDGTVIVGTIGFTLDYLGEHPADLQMIREGERRLYNGGIADLTRRGVVRVTRLNPQLSEPIALEETEETPEAEAPATRPGESLAVEQIDFIDARNTQYLAARRADGRLFWAQTETKTNLRTGEKRTNLRKYELPPPRREARDAEVEGIYLARNGENVYLLFRDGHLVWYDTRDLAANRGSGDAGPVARIAQELKVVEDGRTVSAAEMLLGDFTLIVGDSGGGLAGWFPAPETPDGGKWRMEMGHELAPQPAPVTSVSLSSRDRQFLTGDAEGNLWLRHMTSGTTQAKLELPEGEGAAVTAIAPRTDAAVAIGTGGSLAMWEIHNPHADGKLPQLFFPVHYEGRAGGEFVWQSSAAGDDAEPKLSLVPLIWGTLKATVYAMLFATPIAILAAIYSSEFMQPRVRSVVKPSIEMMAGLPSVVLGYIAAQVLAPWAEDVLGGLLITFAAVPVGVMIFGFLWQLVPPSEVNRQAGRWALGGWGLVALAGLLYYGFAPPLAGIIAWAVIAALLTGIVLIKGDDAGPYMPFVVMGELVLGSILLGLSLGPAFEWLLFGGDLKGWLRGAPEGWVAALPERLQAIPGWTLLLTPLFVVGLVVIFNLYLRPKLPLFDGRGRTRTQLAVTDLLRFAATGIAGLLLATGTGFFLSLIGGDLRSDFLGKITDGTIQSSGIFGLFDPRNALNVGMIMGFAIIPIIYTVSEDALTAVPNTLRSASLGAGATPWQTAVRVVLPVAVSGIFSACMIGLGRAVGETMIVLMAAGNTPTMNLNVFDGMRTLSANIATEMPEAPQGGTLYRVLFLSGLVLFAMTFLVNTLAELVRIRFRKRAFQL